MIIYLHGFRSSSKSVKATQMRDAVAALPPAARPVLVVPDLPHRPAQAIAEVAALVERFEASRTTFVGSSLGGYYATHLAERFGARAIVINPSVRPDEDLRPYAGMQINLYSGETFTVTDAHFDELRALRVPRITRPERYFLLVQTGDELLDYRQAVTFYGGAWQSSQGGGDHAFRISRRTYRRSCDSRRASCSEQPGRSREHPTRVASRPYRRRIALAYARSNACLRALS